MQFPATINKIVTSNQFLFILDGIQIVSKSQFSSIKT